MGSSFPASCLCRKDGNVFFSCRLWSLDMIFVIFCFGEGMRYFFPVFFFSLLLKRWGHLLLLQSPVSLLNGWSVFFIRIPLPLLLSLLNGWGWHMLACPSSASFVAVEGTGTSSFISSVVAEGMMTFPFSSQPPLFSEGMGTLYVFVCIFWKPVIFNQGTQYS